MKLRLIGGILGIFCATATNAMAGDLLLAAFSGDAIYRYDGVSATLFAADPDPGGPNAMNGPTALVYDASGNLLVLNEFSANVLKFNGTTGAFIGSFIPASILAGTAGVLDAGDMELGADGNLYIMSHHNDGGNFIHKFNGTTGAYIGVFAGPGAIRHQHGLAFGPSGDLFQGNVDGGLVERFLFGSGASAGTFAIDASMFPIADLAFGGGNLFVTTSATAGVARFDGTTGVFSSYLAGTAGAPFWGLLVDGGNLYVSNIGAGTIRKYDATTGAFISSTAVGGGAFDIIAMPVPEPGSAGIVLAAVSIAAMRRRSARGKYLR